MQDKALLLSLLLCYSNIFTTNSFQEREDIGFSGLYYGNAHEQHTPKRLEKVLIENVTDALLPDYISGSFIISALHSTSVYNQDTGETQNLKSFLDAFYKMIKIDITNEQEENVFITVKTIKSPYYRESIETKEVANQLLFAEPEPRRKCTHALEVLNMCGLVNARITNMFAASYSIRDSNGKVRYALTSDVEGNLDYNIETLDVIGIRNWEDEMIYKPWLLLGNTHYAIREGDVANGAHTPWRSSLSIEDQPHYGFLGGPTLSNMILSPFDVGKQEGEMIFFRIDPGAPDVRHNLLRFKTDFMLGGFHQWPITPTHAAVIQQPFTSNMIKIIQGHGILESMEEISNKTKIYVFPIDDPNGRVQEFVLDEKIVFLHIVNTFMSATDGGQMMTIYLARNMNNVYQKTNPSLMLDIARNSVIEYDRNELSKTFYNQLGKIELNLETNESRYTFLPTPSNVKTNVSFDFVKMNPDFMGLPSCIYFANEWRHNGKQFGSMSIRKHNICTNKVWYYDDYQNLPYFPSEAVVIPDPKCTAECPQRESGDHLNLKTFHSAEEICRDLCEDSVTLLVLISTGEKGESGVEKDDRINKTMLVAIDGKTMKAINSFQFPSDLRATFTTHAQWFQ